MESPFFDSFCNTAGRNAKTALRSPNFREREGKKYDRHMKIDKRRTGAGFDPRFRACSLADAARTLKLTIEKVRSLEESALIKFRRQKRRDKIAAWAEAVREAAKPATVNYRYLGRSRLEFEPVFLMEFEDPLPGLPSFTKIAFRRIGAITRRRAVSSAERPYGMPRQILSSLRPRPSQNPAEGRGNRPAKPGSADFLILEVCGSSDREGQGKRQE